MEKLSVNRSSYAKHIGVICGMLLIITLLTGRGVAAGEFKVALLTPGSISDAGWNALAYDGLN